MENKTKTILIIENDEDFIIVLNHFLKKTPYKIEVATSSHKSLELAEKNNFDLVHVNSSMPGLNGFEVVKELRKTEKYKTTPIIIFSATRGDVGSIESQKAGANQFVNIPISKERYVNILDQYLLN